MALVEFTNNQPPYINATNLNKIQEGNIYSTTETEIGEWAGEKLYRKIVVFNDSINFDNNQSFNYAHGITNAKTVRIVSSGLYNATIYKYYPMPLIGYEGNFTDKVYCCVDRTNITMYGPSGSWGTGWYKIFVLEYTKITD